MIGARMHSVLATRSVDELRTISAFLADAVAQGQSPADV
jgi:hypothetical protein